MSAREFVMAKYPDAVCVVERTRERTPLYCVTSPSFAAEPGRGLSVWCFSQADAWADAVRRLPLPDACPRCNGRVIGCPLCGPDLRQLRELTNDEVWGLGTPADG